MNTAIELYRELLQRLVSTIGPRTSFDKTLLSSLQQMLGDRMPNQASILAHVYAMGTSIAPIVFFSAMHNFHKTLCDSVAQTVAALPTQPPWLTSEIVAALFPIGAPNAERYRAKNQELILVDPSLMYLLETLSIALASQTMIGLRARGNREAIARYVHNMVLLWTTGRLGSAPEIPPLDEQRRHFGSMIARRALDFIVAHELGHIIANEWVEEGPRLMPAVARDNTWEFEKRELSLAWKRELRADRVACWILSHVVLNDMVRGHKRDDLLPVVFGGAAMAISIAAIHEETSMHPPVFASQQGKARHLHFDETTTHPAACLREVEILTALTTWMGTHDKAESYAKFVFALMPTLWKEGATG